jgi:hypothetical protein
MLTDGRTARGDVAVGRDAGEDSTVGAAAGAGAGMATEGAAAAIAFRGAADLPARYAKEEHTAIAITPMNNQLATWERPRTISNSPLVDGSSGVAAGVSAGRSAGAVADRGGSEGSVSRILSILP